MDAGQYFLENPMETPFIPSWNRVVSAIPDILDQLYDAVEQDSSIAASKVKCKFRNLDLLHLFPELLCLSTSSHSL